MGFLTETAMALLGTARSSLEGPLPLTSQRVIEWLAGPATISGARITPESALRLAAAYAAVVVISQDVAKLPLVTYQRLDQGKVRARQHPIYGVLHDSPNPYMTAYQFRQTMQSHVMTWGNAFANIERDQDGDVLGLWPLRPDHMERPVLSKAGTLIYRYTLPDGQPRDMPQSEILHLRGLATDGLWGLSPIALHRETLGLALAAQEYGARVFANDARPGIVLMYDKRLSDTAIERLRNTWTREHQGLSNAARVAVLEEGITLQTIGFPPEDAQFLETRQFEVQEIARIFRVPPHKIMDLSRATYSNIEEQAIEYVTDTLGAWLANWEQQINKDLLIGAERQVFFAEHLVEALLRGKTLERYQAYQVARQNGWLNADEIRERENLNPIADDSGAVYWRPANMVPADTPAIIPGAGA